MNTHRPPRVINSFIMSSALPTVLHFVSPPHSFKA